MDGGDMKSSAEQRLPQIAIQLEELGFWRDREYVDLEKWTLDREPVALGSPWPTQPVTRGTEDADESESIGCSGVAILEHPSVRIPSYWVLEDSVLLLDPGGESLLTIDHADGEPESFGVDPWHRRFPLRSRQFSIRVEAVPRLPFGIPNPDPRLNVSRLVWVDPHLTRLHRRLWLLYKAAVALAGEDAVGPLTGALERVLATLDWPSATREYVARTQTSRQMQEIWQLPEDLPHHPGGLNEGQRGSVREANCRLDKELADLTVAFPPMGGLAVTGHAHIDLAWLWPMDETRRKARRTFSTALALMDRYPELRFNQSSAQIYSFIEEDDPAMFEAIKRRVASGQWEPVGGMWVEPDMNMPTGESLVRQLLLGQRYFKKTFGRQHDTCWVPDCFGFTPALPQLLQQAGIPSFFTIKLTWSETNDFLNDLFWWEGLDGTRVLAHMFDNPGHADLGTSGYNGDPSPHATVSTWRNFRGKDIHGESLFSIGYGDGGGGVTFEMAEWMRDLETFPALPALRFSTVSDFYERLRVSIGDKPVPVWRGELYLELHRGTLTTQGRTKYLHRRSERDLIAAETVSGLAALSGGDPADGLGESWKILLRNQFHDILPGSSIREVYERANQELESVVAEARSRVEEGVMSVARRLTSSGESTGILCVNPDVSARPLRLELAHPFPGAQEVEGGSVLAGRDLVPGLGARVVAGVSDSSPLSVSKSSLENDFVRVELDSSGTLSSVVDKRNKREVLAGRGNQLWAYVDKPRNWDAWDIEETYGRDGREINDVEAIEVVETGPHRAAIRLTRRFRDSRVIQEIRLWSNSPRLEFKTTMDWHDRHWLIKARFPLNVRSERATFETAFGVVERPTHRNTSWEQAKFEVAAHRFADLSEPGYGVALLNDGKYGHHALGNELGISLLRAPVYPDPLADEGVQSFVYALYPHSGTWLEGGVLMEAEDLNRPMPTLPVRAGTPTEWRPIGLSGIPMALGTLKPMEDDRDALVLRIYEPQGRRGPVQITVPEGWNIAGETNILEDGLHAPDFQVKPFEVKSFVLRRTS
jgi:alpha-mannosidase